MAMAQPVQVPAVDVADTGNILSLCRKLRLNPLVVSPSPNHQTFQGLCDENPNGELTLELLLPARHCLQLSPALWTVSEQPPKARTTHVAILQMGKLRQGEVQ